MTDDETFPPREVGPITPEQVAMMLKAATDYLRSQNLFVNIAIAVVEENGFYTVGNMPDRMMEQVFRLYLARATLADSKVSVVDQSTGQIYDTH